MKKSLILIFAVLVSCAVFAQEHKSLGEDGFAASGMEQISPRAAVWHQSTKSMSFRTEHSVMSAV